MPITFTKPSLIVLDGTTLSEHSRSPLAISYERIAQNVRTANGTLRRFFVADKRSFSLSWDMIPGLAADTVDGFAGAKDLETKFSSTTGSVTMTINYGQGSPENVTVMVEGFSIELQKRWDYDWYNVSIDLVEV